MNKADLPSLSEFHESGPYQGTMAVIQSVGSSGLTVASLVLPRGEYPDPALSDILIVLTRNRGEAVVDVGGGRFTWH